LVQNKELE